MKLRSHTLLTLISGALCSAVAALGQPTPVAPYTVSVFATGTEMYTQPDSIAVTRDGIFIGYGNNACKDGTCGTSTIVQYSKKGEVINLYTVPGHNDGLRAEPKTHRIWALQNEDGNPALVIIDSKKGTETPYTFAPTVHGGGYDDITFISDGDRDENNELHDAFLSASNPSKPMNTDPAIVRAHLNQDFTVSLSPVLLGNATATDVTNGKSVTLNLQDPDSMILNPSGDLVLDSQSDSELVIVHDPGSEDDQSVFVLPLADAKEQVDDTVFATSSHGVILVSDRDAGTTKAGIVYATTNPEFASGAAYTAALTSVGKLDFQTGVITPVVTGMVSPHGMAFIGRDRERNFRGGPPRY